MIDMHSHILFGVDDGAKTLEDSLELIKEEVNKGVTHIIFTPHFNKRNYHLNQENVPINFQTVKEASIKENLNVQLYLGNEIYLDSTDYNSIMDNGFYTLAGSKYILVEFNEIIPPANMPEICYEINMSGYIPIIAHAERYEILHNNTKMLSELLNEGVHLQVNAFSVISNDNKTRNKVTHHLLKDRLVSFVASDVHNNTTRKFHLDEAYKLVIKICGIEYADKIFIHNQLNILNDFPFDSPDFILKKNKFSKFWD